jgi:hypothetical protein
MAVRSKELIGLQPDVISPRERSRPQIDAMPGPNGVPSGISAGALAVTRALQQGQVARNNSTRVVIGLIGGMSI